MNTTYFLNVVAGNVLKTKSIPALPTKFYLGLSSTAPNLDGTGATEPATSAGYKRVELTSLSEPANGVVTNDATIDFDESTAALGHYDALRHFRLRDWWQSAYVRCFERKSHR